MSFYPFSANIPFPEVTVGRCSSKNLAIFTGIHLFRSLFLLKRDSNTGVLLDFAKFLRKAFFIEHLAVASAFLYPLKRSYTFWFYYVFRGYGNGTLA